MRLLTNRDLINQLLTLIANILTPVVTISIILEYVQQQQHHPHRNLNNNEQIAKQNITMDLDVVQMISLGVQADNMTMELLVSKEHHGITPQQQSCG
jgi:hypothetical protein